MPGKYFNKIFLTTIVSLLVAGIKIKAQTQLSEQNFLQVGSTAIQEKIFAHTDKNFYLAGEIIWFKLYAVSADSLKPLNLSNVAYVEILNAQQKPVLQSTVSLNDGDGSGSFYLPSSITSGNYIFRAYTNWMKNFGADNYFQKIITVVNTLKPLTNSSTINADNYTINFYPEGGNLIADLQSKLAFTITDKYGKGVNCNGNIVDENNNTVTSFTTLRFGIGSFYFTPQKNHSYTAVVNINGKQFKQTLPIINNNGYAMHVTNNGNEYTITVNTNTGIQQHVYLSASSNSNAKMFSQVIDANGKATFSINKNQLNAGITRLTILDADKQPQCERLIFLKPQSLQLNIKADKEIYETRSAVNIAAASLPADADVSVAVYLIDSLQTSDDNNIINYSFLTSALKSNIESPQYYFNNTAEADSALDNLLLTQKSVAQNTQTTFRYLPEHEGHIIEGKVFDKNSGLPAAHVRVFLSVPGLYYKFASAVSNDSGKVMFDIKDAYGSNEVVVQTAKEDSMYRVEIADPYSHETSSWIVPDLKLSETNLQQLALHNIAMQVQNAYTINELNTFTSPVVDTTAFYGVPDNTYDLDNYTRFNTMEEVLREYIANVDVRIRGNNYLLRSTDNNHHGFFDTDPLVLVDGVPIFDMNKVIAYNPLKIKKAEIVNRKFYINSYTANGIVSYSTYKGNLDGFPFDQNATELSYDGLQLLRQFYFPRYNTAAQKQTRIPDYRSTLYWDNTIVAKSNQQISFYTSDVKGNFIIVVQGISEDGKPCFGTTQFTVK